MKKKLKRKNPRRNKVSLEDSLGLEKKKTRKKKLKKLKLRRKKKKKLKLRRRKKNKLKPKLNQFQLVTLFKIKIQARDIDLTMHFHNKFIKHQDLISSDLYYISNLYFL